MGIVLRSRGTTKKSQQGHGTKAAPAWQQVRQVHRQEL
jgi:hypothetical protein